MLIQLTHYIRLSMRKQFFASLFLLILAVQIFPVQGFEFWHELIKGKSQANATMSQMLDEEEVETLAFKIKKAESSHSFFFEFTTLAAPLQSPKWFTLSLGNIMDRTDPILIPPPNELA